MIWVSQDEESVFTTSTPGIVTSVFLPSPHSIRAESGFGSEGQGGMNSPGTSVESYPKIPSVPRFSSSSKQTFHHSAHKFQIKKNYASASENSKEAESDENNNTDLQDSQASGSSSILSALSGRRARYVVRKRKSHRLQEV